MSSPIRIEIQVAGNQANIQAVGAQIGSALQQAIAKNVALTSTLGKVVPGGVGGIGGATGATGAAAAGMAAVAGQATTLTQRIQALVGAGGSSLNRFFGAINTGAAQTRVSISSISSSITALGASVFVLEKFSKAAYASMVSPFIEANKAILLATENSRAFRNSLSTVAGSFGRASEINQALISRSSGSPLTLQATREAATQFAQVPSLAPFLANGSPAQVAAQAAGFARSLGQLQSLSPEQSIGGAALSTKEFIAGQYSSIRRRFEIPPELIAASIGKSLDELNTPQLRLKALQKYLDIFVSEEQFQRLGQSYTVRIEKLFETFKIAGEKIGDSGLFNGVVRRLKTLGDTLFDYFETDDFKGKAARISVSLENTLGSVGDGFVAFLDKLSGSSSGGTAGGVVESITVISEKLEILASKLSKVGSILGDLGRSAASTIDDILTGGVGDWFDASNDHYFTQATKNRIHEKTKIGLSGAQISAAANPNVAINDLGNVIGNLGHANDAITPSVLAIANRDYGDAQQESTARQLASDLPKQIDELNRAYVAISQKKPGEVSAGELDAVLGRIQSARELLIQANTIVDGSRGKPGIYQTVKTPDGRFFRPDPNSLNAQFSKASADSLRDIGLAGSQLFGIERFARENPAAASLSRRTEYSTSNVPSRLLAINQGVGRILSGPAATSDLSAEQHQNPMAELQSRVAALFGGGEAGSLHDQMYGTSRDAGVGAIQAGPLSVMKIVAQYGDAMTTAMVGLKKAAVAYAEQLLDIAKDLPPDVRSKVEDELIAGTYSYANNLKGLLGGFGLKTGSYGLESFSPRFQNRLLGQHLATGLDQISQNDIGVASSRLGATVDLYSSLLGPGNAGAGFLANDPYGIAMRKQWLKSRDQTRSQLNALYDQQASERFQRTSNAIDDGYSGQLLTTANETLGTYSSSDRVRILRKQDNLQNRLSALNDRYEGAQATFAASPTDENRNQYYAAAAALWDTAKAAREAADDLRRLGPAVAEAIYQHQQSAIGQGYSGELPANADDLLNSYSPSQRVRLGRQLSAAQKRLEPLRAQYAETYALAAANPENAKYQEEFRATAAALEQVGTSAREAKQSLEDLARSIPKENFGSRLQGVDAGYSGGELAPAASDLLNRDPTVSGQQKALLTERLAEHSRLLDQYTTDRNAFNATPDDDRLRAHLLESKAELLENEKALRQVELAVNDLQQAYQELARATRQALEHGIGDVLYDLESGTGNVKDAVRAMLQDILHSFADAQAQLLVKGVLGGFGQQTPDGGTQTNFAGSLIGGIIGAIGGAFTHGAVGGANQSFESPYFQSNNPAPIGYANGGIVRGGFGPMLPIRAFASGGIVQAGRPQIGIIGEGQHDELVVPLKGGRVPLERIGGGSSSPPIVNVVVVHNEEEAWQRGLSKHRSTVVNLVQKELSSGHSNKIIRHPTKR